jgi:hypothetical protein
LFILHIFNNNNIKIKKYNNITKVKKKEILLNKFKIYSKSIFIPLIFLKVKKVIKVIKNVKKILNIFKFSKIEIPLLIKKI